MILGRYTKTLLSADTAAVGGSEGSNEGRGRERERMRDRQTEREHISIRNTKKIVTFFNY